jgi:hypothetical protein
MHTPAGKECRHYYQDFHRGRKLQECRLVKENPESMRWRPADCSNCPVPDILNANASPLLRLKITIKARLLGLGRQVEVEAFCADEPISIAAAYTDCHDLEDTRGLDLFRQALEQNDDD